MNVHRQLISVAESSKNTLCPKKIKTTLYWSYLFQLPFQSERLKGPQLRKGALSPNSMHMCAGIFPKAKNKN